MHYLRNSGLFIIVLFLIILSACQTESNRQFEHYMTNLQDDKYNIQIRIIETDELKERAGRIQSPYITPVNIFETREFVVIELAVKNKSNTAARFQLQNLQLSVGAGTYQTKNAFLMKRMWDQYDIEATERARMYKMLDQQMFDREITIPPDGLKRGWIVFFANLPKYGEMTVSLPLFGEGFKPDIYEFDFAFTNFN